jgi:hypothetical protein
MAQPELNTQRGVGGGRREQRGSGLLCGGRSERSRKRE